MDNLEQIMGGSCLFMNKNVCILDLMQDDINLHKHDFFELVYVTSGSAVQTLSDKTFTVQKGDYFIVDYGTYHNYSSCKDFKIINCLFKPEFIDKTLVECDSFSRLITNYLIRFNYTILNHIPVNFIFHDINSEILTHFQILREEFNKMQPGHIELIRCHIIEILVLSMRNIARSDHFYNAHPATVKIMQYIDENFSNPVSLTELCKNMNFSLQYISTRFKSDTGMTFNHFLQKTRIEQSCRLLVETDLLISDVAHAVGYEDIKFFGKIFRQIVNTSPSKFRKMAKEK